MKKPCTLSLCFTLFISFSIGFISGNTTAFGADGPKLLEPALILSKEDAKALTGISFAECAVKEQPAVNLKLCVYEKDDAFLQLGLTQMGKNGKRPEDIYNTIKGAFKDAARIEGVGDDNFIAPPGLHIMKDGYYLTVSLGSLNRNPEKLKAAGLLAVTNLSKSLEK